MRSAYQCWFIFVFELVFWDFTNTFAENSITPRFFVSRSSLANSSSKPLHFVHHNLVNFHSDSSILLDQYELASLSFDAKIKQEIPWKARESWTEIMLFLNGGQLWRLQVIRDKRSVNNPSWILEKWFHWCPSLMYWSDLSSIRKFVNCVCDT